MKTINIYLALDLETSGLDPMADKIVEVAWKLVSSRLESLSDGVAHAVIRPVGDTLDRIKANPVVLEMHTKTGLLALLEDDNHPKPTLASAEDRIIRDLDIVAENFETYKLTNDKQINYQIVLIGKNVAFDHKFIDRYMPRLAKRVSYREFDETSVNFLLDAIGITISMPLKSVSEEGLVAHRAAYDVNATYTRLRGVVGTLRMLLNRAGISEETEGMLLSQDLGSGEMEIVDDSTIDAELESLLESDERE